MNGGLLISIMYCVIFVGMGSFLYLFTVRERLRMKWYVLVPLVLANAGLYYMLRLVSWLGILPYLLAAFFFLRGAAKVDTQKTLYLMLVIITYLLFSNAVFFAFEGSAYTWDLYDLDTVLLGFCASGPFMAWFLRRKIWPALRAAETSEVRWLWVIPTTFMTLNVILFSSHIQSLLTFQLVWPYTMIATVFALATVCVCFLVLDMLKKTEDVMRFKGNMSIVDAELHMQAKRFAELSAYMEDVRVIRHDMRHHMRVLGSMLEEERYGLAREYLNEYVQETEKTEIMPLCPNHVVDLVVRRFYELAEEAGVTVKTECAVPGKSWIQDVDMCTILGNLLENAYHACKLQQCGEKYISLQVRVYEHEAMFLLENSCREGAYSEEDMVYAGVPKGGGRGTLSIEAVARKYGGMAKFVKEGPVFRSSILMYKQKEEEDDPEKAVY